jgi:hypothetical protein
MRGKSGLYKVNCLFGNYNVITTDVKTNNLSMRGRRDDLKIRSFSFLASALFLIITLNVTGQQRQTEYTDEELITFIQVAREIMPLQEESQMRMIEEIENEGLSIERFNMILEAHSMGQDIDYTEEEHEAFHNALDGIQDVQEEYEEKIFDVIRDEGMSPDRYQAILADYQQDPELQRRVNTLIEGGED